MHFINRIWKIDVKEQLRVTRKRHVTKFQLGLNYCMVSHKVLIWDLYCFLVYINDLPAIRNYKSITVGESPLIWGDFLIWGGALFNTRRC